MSPSVRPRATGEFQFGIIRDDITVDAKLAGERARIGVFATLTLQHHDTPGYAKLRQRTDFRPLWADGAKATF